MDGSIIRVTISGISVRQPDKHGVKQEALGRFMTDFNHPDRSGHVASDFDRSDRNHQEDINRARQAAEALFAPKQRVTEPAVVPVASPDQTTRKPRILSAVPAQPTRVEAITSPVKDVFPKKHK